MDRASRSLIGQILPVVLAALVGIGAAWAWHLKSPGRAAPAPAQTAPPRPTIVPAGPAAAAIAAAAPLPAEDALTIVPETPVPKLVPPPAAAAARGAEPAEGAEADGPPDGGPADLPPGEKLRFREIWSYLMPGEIGRWSEAAPITDLCLFDFSLNDIGGLSGKVDTAAIERAARQGIRTHMAVASSGNKTLLHLVLSPRYGVRSALIEALAQWPRKYKVNGVQLDFEGPRLEERADLVSFVRDLRSALPPESLLSLAIPARTSDAGSAFVYADLAEIADRLFIMVYDEHWSGGEPGSIADLAWHNRVLAFARSKLAAEKVVVGLPFYGRVWQPEKLARALNHRQVRELADKVKAPVRWDPAKSHSFTFRSEVTAECWFEDAASLRAKLESARSLGFVNVGFWRLGQEDPRIWTILERS